jgi:hypothetical protein
MRKFYNSFSHKDVLWGTRTRNRGNLRLIHYGATKSIRKMRRAPLARDRLWAEHAEVGLAQQIE